MQIRYRSLTLDTGTAGVRIAITPRRNDAQQIVSHFQTWTIEGQLLSQDGDYSDIDAQAQALMDAYSRDGGNLTWLLPDGSASANRILNANALGGVRLKSFELPEYRGAQRVTILDFRAVFEAELPVSNSQRALLSYTEDITWSGGGPVYRYGEPVWGEPRRQLVVRQSVFRATQSGMAIGYLEHPRAPGKLWPANLVQDNPPKRTAPKRIGRDFTEFTVSWSWDFESSRPLIGNPHRWPG